jgi:ankyrin repeat protein
MKQQAVRALLDANPSQASTADTFKRTPLHLACMDVAGNFHSSDDSVLLELLDRAPHAVHLTDIERRTPLHYLLARNDDIPLSLLTKMVALSPETLTMKDEVGETPLDIIESRKEEIPNADEVIETLMKLKSMLTSSARVILEKHTNGSFNQSEKSET